MIPEGEAIRVPASDLRPGDIYAKTKHGPGRKVISRVDGDRACYFELEPAFKMMGGGIYFQRIRPRKTTLVWRQKRAGE